MRQVIIGGYANNLSASAVEYNTVAGGGYWSAAINLCSQVISTPGRLSRLFVVISAAPGAGKSYTFALMKNGIPQDLEVAIEGASATTSSDLADAVDVYAGDEISLRCTPSGTPTVAVARWTVVFEGTEVKESLILGASSTSTSATRYAPISHGDSTQSTTETNTYQVIPVAGTIKNLMVRFDLFPGTGSEGYRVTLRKNGVSTDLTVTITATTKGNDLTNEVTVAAGDYVNLMVEPLNSPTNAPNMAWGMTFVSDTDGYSLLLGQSSSSDYPSQSATEYHELVSTVFSTFWTATESGHYQEAQSFGAILQKFYVKLSAAPDTGKSYTFKVRQNGADSDLSVLIEDTDTTGNDTSNTLTLADWDYLALSSTPSGTPDNTVVYWGVGCYIAPPTAGTSHDIVLEKPDGTRRGYMIVPGSERKQPVNQFAPVIANTSDPMFAEGVWRSWSMEKFVGGCSDLEWESRESFLSSNLVETRHERGLSLASDIESSDASVDVLKFISYREALGSELLSNPGMEDWTADEADNWTDANGDSAEETTDKHGGSSSNKFTLGNSVVNGTVSQTIVTVASSVYKVSIWPKLVPVAAWKNLKIRLRAKDTTSENTKGEVTGSPADWTEYSFYFTAESIETRIELIIEGSLSANRDIVYWDDASAKIVSNTYSATFALLASGNKVRRYTGGAWADADTGLAADCTDGAVFGNYLYVGLGTAQSGRKNTSGSWSEWATNATFICAYNDKLCWSKINVIYHDASPETPTTTDKFDVGESNSDITGLAVYAGYLYIGKEDGTLWRWDGTTLTHLMTLRGRDSTDNFNFMAEHEGFLFFNIGRDIYQYSPTAMVKITPVLGGTDNAEKFGFGVPTFFQSIGGFLYVAFDDGEAVYPYVLAYDRARGAWHIVHKGDAGATMYGMGYDLSNAYLWLNDGTSRYQMLTPDSDRIYPNYAESGEFITAWFKGSFPFQPKCYADITIKARGCVAVDEERVTVYYELDRSGTWTELGTVIEDGLTKFRLDETYGGKEGKEIRLKLELDRTTGDDFRDRTPIVESFHVAFMDRPESVYVYRVIVKMAEDLAGRDGEAETYTVAQLKTHIEECYESVVPIIYEPRIDTSVWVFIRTFSALEPLKEEGRREMMYDLQMIDAVTSGLEQA